MLSLFGFGKSRRKVSRRKVSRRKVTRRKAVRKLPSKLVKLCKRYGVKTTTKRGGRRVQKSVAVLKRAVAKKIKLMLKRHKKQQSKRGVKKSSKRRSTRKRTTRRRRSTKFNTTHEMMYGGMKNRFGASCSGNVNNGMMAQFGARRRPNRMATSKKDAYDAFRNMYGSMRNRYHFGNGGNPMLSQTMGSEFCSGGGGVLGANSTGLFPSPCMDIAAKGLTGAALAATNFGKKRRINYRRRYRFGENETPDIVNYDQFPYNQFLQDLPSSIASTMAYGRRRPRRS